MGWRDDGQGCVGQGCKPHQAQPGLSCVVWRREERRKKVGTETGWGKEGFRAILCVSGHGVWCYLHIMAGGIAWCGRGGPLLAAVAGPLFLIFWLAALVFGHACMYRQTTRQRRTLWGDRIRENKATSWE